jgi:type I restriction enzyme S subunit
VLKVRHKFEDIAINSIAKKKPTATDKDTYIGLEHLDPGTFVVSRFGGDSAPIGEKLLMKKGDVLFGKRRAYQKKVAIAPFDGIFSAHGMVLRPNEDVVDCAFFPFFISSDYFLDAAINISVGSLSPTINWGTLKNLEFELPTLDEQRKLADLLWAANTTREAYKKLLAITDELVKSQFVEMFGDPTFPKVKLSEISDCFIGLTYKPADVSDDGVVVLRSGNIQNGQIDLVDLVRVTTPIREKLFVQEDDILMCSRNGSASLVGKTALIPDLGERMTFGAFMTIIRSEYSHYLLSFFQSEEFFEQVSMAKTSTINQITKAMLDNVVVKLPPLDLQHRFAAFVQQADKSKFEIHALLLNWKPPTMPC